MSRRKDQERFEAMKRLDPDYRGFRGRRNEPDKAGKTPLEAVVCSVCGRKRNVPRGIALEQGEGYICIRCSADDRSPEAADAQQQA